MMFQLGIFLVLLYLIIPISRVSRLRWMMPLIRKVTGIHNLVWPDFVAKPALEDNEYMILQDI